MAQFPFSTYFVFFCLCSPYLSYLVFFFFLFLVPRVWIPHQVYGCHFRVTCSHRFSQYCKPRNHIDSETQSHVYKTPLCASMSSPLIGTINTDNFVRFRGQFAQICIMQMRTKYLPVLHSHVIYIHFQLGWFLPNIAAFECCYSYGSIVVKLVINSQFRFSLSIFAPFEFFIALCFFCVSLCSYCLLASPSEYNRQIDKV